MAGCDQAPSPPKFATVINITHFIHQTILPYRTRTKFRGLNFRVAISYSWVFIFVVVPRTLYSKILSGTMHVIAFFD